MMSSGAEIRPAHRTADRPVDSLVPVRFEAGKNSWCYSGGLRVFCQIGTEIAERADGGRCPRLEAVAQRLEHHHAAAGLAV